MRGYTGVCVGALHNVICMLPSRLGLGVGGLVGLEWVPGSPRRSKKVSSNESRWFLVFRPKVDFRCFRGYPIHIHSWVLSANFSGVALCFWATIVSCPLIFVKTENWKMCEKRWKSAVFFRIRRAYPRSPDALWAANSWTLGCWLMLIDSTSFKCSLVDHQSRWLLFQTKFFGPKSRKSIVFAKAARN